MRLSNYIDRKEKRQIGLMRYRITVKKRQYVDDGIGGDISMWGNVLSCWADIVRMTGSETLRYGLNMSDVAYRVTVRKNEIIDTSCIVVHDSNDYHINSIESEDERYYTLICTYGQRN